MISDEFGTPIEHIDYDKVKLFLSSLMDKYKYGEISPYQFCVEIRQFYDVLALPEWEDDNMKMLIDQMLPKLVSALEARDISIDFPDTEKQKKIESWILFKDCERLLSGSELFSKERERFFRKKKKKKDDSEYTDRYLLYEREMEIIVRAEAGTALHVGYCHIYWIFKKRVLREIFGIDWHSPADRYPGVRFD